MIGCPDCPLKKCGLTCNGESQEGFCDVPEMRKQLEAYAAGNCSGQLLRELPDDRKDKANPPTPRKPCGGCGSKHKPKL